MVQQTEYTDRGAYQYAFNIFCGKITFLHSFVIYRGPKVKAVEVADLSSGKWTVFVTSQMKTILGLCELPLRKHLNTTVAD